MKNMLERQVPGSVDEVVDRLVELLEQQGLTATPSDGGGDTDVRTVDVTDADAVAEVTDVAPDAAPVATVSIALRPNEGGTRITVIDPAAKATVTGEAEVIQAAQAAKERITAALDSLVDERSSDSAGQQPDTDVRGPDVRDALLAEIQAATTSLAELDVQQRADTLFVLAKAYTAIASLERTEEIELHLA